MTSSAITPYQGGLPVLHTRYGPRQTGSGFFSSLKRFLIPIAKTAFPHVAGAVGDLVSGKSAKEVLKSRGRSAGASLLRGVGDMIDNREDNSSSAPSVPKKAYKRKATVGKSSVSPKKRNRKQSSTWN